MYFLCSALKIKETCKVAEHCLQFWLSFEIFVIEMLTYFTVLFKQYLFFYKIQNESNITLYETPSKRILKLIKWTLSLWKLRYLNHLLKLVCIKAFCRCFKIRNYRKQKISSCLFSVINLKTNRCVKIHGKPENPRLLKIGLFQGSGRKSKAAPDVHSEASDNPILQTTSLDPILFCTAFKKNRFYLFSRREPFDPKR